MTRPVPVWARWIALVVLVLAAGAAGRFTAPERVDVREIVTVRWRERVVEKRIEIAARARVETRTVYRDRTVTPDGTVTEHEVERTGSAEGETRRTEDTREAESEGSAVRELVRTVEVRPDWRVAVQAGAALQRPALELAGPLVLGLEVDRRIVGGLSAGVWANTYGAGGVALSLEF